jgi:hypothetical protein
MWLRRAGDQLSNKIQLLLRALPEIAAAIVTITKPGLIKSDLCANSVGKCHVALIGSQLQSALRGRYCVGKLSAFGIRSSPCSADAGVALISKDTCHGVFFVEVTNVFLPQQVTPAEFLFI